MSTVLGPRFDHSFTGRPAHMSPEDRQIWERWWPTIRHQIKDLYFDVRVGKGKEAPLGEPENFRKMWTDLTQKRIDVVLTRPGEVWLVEIRFAASPNAIGRLLTYHMLWQDDPALPGKVELYIVTNIHDEEVARASALAGITYIVV